LALAGIVAFFPFMLFLTVLVKSTSEGPAFFAQERSGVGGRPFTIYKYRTMYVGAEKDKEKFRHLNVKDGPAFKIPDDPRLTNVGRILSQTFLDELPQLFNILRGDMSFVGPRPPTPDEVEHYEGWQARRLDVKGGLTSPWVIQGMHRLSFDEWMRSDLAYIQNMNILTDLEIIFKTVFLVVKVVFKTVKEAFAG